MKARQANSADKKKNIAKYSKEKVYDVFKVI